MKPRTRASSRGIRIALIILVGLSLAALAWFVWPSLQPRLGTLLAQRGIALPAGKGSPVKSSSMVAGAGKSTPSVAEPAMATAGPTATPTDTSVPILLPNNASPQENLRAQGALLLAMRDGSFVHLFAYHPLYLPLTRLTNNPWDDITPAVSPDGSRLAYASRQNGYWDLYILDLTTGQQSRLTDTPEYEASPSWSPDGQWIAYERYSGVSLDVYIQPINDPSTRPIQLTDDPGIDRAPAWSPLGREIAFVSSRSGDEEIWLARLDNIDDRFINLSNNPQTRDRNPVWSADGHKLAWTTEAGGDRRLAVWNTDQPDVPARPTGEGDRVAWSPDGAVLFSEVRDPSGSGLAAYASATGRLNLPYTQLPGALYGMTWVKGPLPAWIEGLVNNPDTSPAPALWQPMLTRTIAPAGRFGLVPLADVSAPQPMLHDAVDEAFNSLRQQLAAETGWDVLSSLENAYVPLTAPPAPTLEDDWLYTGRAFALNPLLLSAGWMAISREDFNGQTYWRVYLKARYQDGSMGQPLTDQTWDINARFAGDPRAYEQGGKSGPVPAGYWIDLTEIAGRYGWERLPSWINWRTFFPSIRFNQFVITGGLEWSQAMAQLYPPEALVTATQLPTATLMITDTLESTPRPVTATPTPTLTMIPTRRPTWTPLPQQPAP